ncbi:MAG: hypothetical protein ACI4LC_04560 [Emergencia sp.]
MFEKINITKENLSKLIIALIVAAVFLLTMSILTDDNDSRKFIGSGGRGSETALCSFLSDIDGVGSVSALIEYDTNEKVVGVVVTAEGAADPVVRNNIVKGVSTLYDVPATSVMVFQKDTGVNGDEKNQ